MERPGFPMARASQKEDPNMQSPGDDAPWLEIDSGVIRHAIPPELLGSASISTSGRFEAGSLASITLTYTAGKFGFDDSGSLRICFRVACDQVSPQFEDPAGPKYCMVAASNDAALQFRGTQGKRPSLGQDLEDQGRPVLPQGRGYHHRPFRRNRLWRPRDVVADVP